MRSLLPGRERLRRREVSLTDLVCGGLARPAAEAQVVRLNQEPLVDSPGDAAAPGHRSFLVVAGLGNPPPFQTLQPAGIAFVSNRRELLWSVGGCC
jgi:hypothetical protein